MKNKLLVMTLFILLLLGISTISYGAISATSKTINSGENVTISVSSAEKLGAYTLKVTDNGGLTFVSSSPVAGGAANGTTISGASTEGITSLGSFTFKAPTVSKDTTYYVKISSTGTEGPGPTYANVSPSTATATITVKAPVQNLTPTPTTKPTTKPSTAPTTLTFADVNETVYTSNAVNFRSSYGTSAAKIGTIPAGATLTRTGKSSTTLNGEYWSKVVYNNQTGYVASSYLTTTKPEEKPSPTPALEKSNDATLKSLSITGIEITPVFNPTTLNYEANILDENITKVEVLAVANNEKAVVEITGNDNLQNGANTINIKVTAEDGTVTNYTIKAIKGEEKEDNNIIIMAIKENDQRIAIDIGNVIEIDENTMECTVNLQEWFKSIEILGNSNTEGSYVGTGVFDLATGENKYTVKHQISDSKTVEYKITVNNPEKVTQIVAENNKTNNKMDYKLIAIISAIVVVAIMVIILIIRHRKQDDMKYTDTNYSFLRNDEDIEVKESKENKQELLDNFLNSEDDGYKRKGGKHF